MIGSVEIGLIRTEGTYLGSRKEIRLVIASDWRVLNISRKM